jgi:hypothetical protein
MAEYCARCKRRTVVTYHVPDNVKRLVLLNRWKSGVCAGCFDELAEKGGMERPAAAAQPAETQVTETPSTHQIGHFRRAPQD